MEAVKADAGLQEQLKAASDADAVAAIAKAAGFVITAEEFAIAQAEISEEELTEYLVGVVLRSENLFSATEHSWHRIQAFLGLDAVPLPAPRERANSGHGEADTVPPQVRAQLQHQLAGTAAAMEQRYGVRWD